MTKVMETTFIASKVSLPYSIVVGGILYRLLIGRVRPRLGNAMLSGACTAAILGLLLAVLLEVILNYDPRGLEEPSMVPIIIVMFGSFALCVSAGGFGGFVFWVFAAWRDPMLSSPLGHDRPIPSRL